MKDYLPAELENKLVEWNHKASALGPEWAVAEGEFFSCMERKNDILADIMSKITIPPTEKDSSAIRERLARISSEWQMFKQSLVDAKATTLQKKIAYEVAIRTWETIKGLLYSKNIERRQM